MTDYIYSLKYQKKIAGKWYDTEVTFAGRHATDENVELATSSETLKFFRRLGSKQQVRRTVKKTKDGEYKYVITIYSYQPSDRTVRAKHEYIEV